MQTSPAAPPTKICPTCIEPFTAWRSRYSNDGWVTCCSEKCRRQYIGRLQLVNGSHAKACQTRRLRCAERMAQVLKGLSVKQAYQLGWKRGFQRGRDRLNRLGIREDGRSAVHKAGKVM